MNDEIFELRETSEPDVFDVYLKKDIADKLAEDGYVKLSTQHRLESGDTFLEAEVDKVVSEYNLPFAVEVVEDLTDGLDLKKDRLIAKIKKIQA